MENQKIQTEQLQHHTLPHQQLLQQVIISETGLDEQLGTTLKAFYKLNKQAALVDQLSNLVQKKEMEIEKTCNAHYQDFVQSVDQLLVVRADAQRLRLQLQGFSSSFNTTCSSILEKKRELAAYRKVYLNIENTKEIIRNCLFVLEFTRKMNFLIEKKSYYSALKTCEELHHHYLAYVGKFDFISLLQESIPIIQENVKSIVLSELKECIREWSRTVGQLAMAKTRKEELKDGVVGDLHSSIKELSRSQSVLAAATRKSSRKSLQSLSWKSLEQALKEDDEWDLFINDTVQVDYRPLYQCIHIYDVLGSRHSLKLTYEENRRLQANLILTAQFSLNENDLSSFEKYLYDIVGFFIVEAHIASSTENFRTRASIELLWEMATEKLHEVISTSLQNCQNPAYFLHIKELMITFIQTLENYNFNVFRLVNLLITFFERYSNLKMLEASDVCDGKIEHDDGSCVVAHGIMEYQDVLKIYYYKEQSNNENSKVVFPRIFPFSSSFLACCNEIKQLIFGFYHFAEGFHQEFNEMDDILKKTVENLINNHICSSITTKLNTLNIKLSEVVRIILNLEHYQHFVTEIEDVISKKRASYRLASPRNERFRNDEDKKISANLVQNCQQKLQESRKIAENRLFELVNKKIDDFLDLAVYNICPMEPGRSSSPTKEFPSNRSEEPSQYLSDLVAFMDVVWTSTLAELPMAVKSFVYYDAIFHLVSRLLAMINGSNVKKISPIFIDGQFSTDVTFLETFVSRLGDPNLIDQMIEIRQIVNFLRSDTNFEEYLISSVRNKKYSRISKATALALMEKIKEGGFWNDSSSLMNALGISAGLSATNNAKDARAMKRKQIETTIKGLREDLSKK